jgi:DMSO reductase family type II enzyme heme b subunit
MPSYAGVYTDEQLWDLIHYVQSLVPPGVEDRTRMHPQTIRARRVRGELLAGSVADAWRTVDPVVVALTPLWWRDDRIADVEVKALHNGKELALHLSWADTTQDTSLMRPQDFSDGVAVQLSAESDPPFFGMGDHRSAVAMWHWKAAWQQDQAGGWQDIETAYPHAAVDWYQHQRDYRHGDAFEVREAKTASQDPAFMAGWGAGNPLSSPERSSSGEEAGAKGLGTLTAKPLAAQRVQADGAWRDGRWQVVLRRTLTPAEKGELALRPGQTISVALAVWDGQVEDRDGQKSVSIWNTLQLER